MAEAMRVALLARPGTACDKLQAALQQVGADLVHVADPTGGDVATLAAADPGAVLVALEPAVEGALAGYDAILHDPSRIVIYDEAELAAQREGWASARWVRHLAAKLGGHTDVLPPGGEGDDAPEAPAAIEAEPEPEPEPEPAFESGSAWQLEPAPEPESTEATEATEATEVVNATDATDATDATAMGGVVVLSGIGGPDAVRQCLGALPSGLPRPVLVRQRLDGGRHDRLVRQLQRATSLPVELAAAGMALAPGHV